MANINIDNLSELDLNGNDLFGDSEGFMMDLTEDELINKHGGILSSPVCVAITVAAVVSRHL